MFFFVCHLESPTSPYPRLVCSPCPEYDLELARESEDAIMRVISPPLRLPQAHRAVGDAVNSGKLSLADAFRSVSRSVKAYGGGARMPCRPVEVPASGGIDMEAPAKAGKELASRVKGRLLRMQEAAYGPMASEPSLISMAAQYASARLGMRIAPGITYRGYGGRACSRCGATTGFYLGDCPSCGSDSCLVCAECEPMGAMRECEPVYSLEAGPVIPDLRKRHAAVLKYPLTPAQERASSFVRGWYRENTATEALIWAVCGAGKTEVSFSAMEEALNRGGRVMYAAPRRDVVAEIGERITASFPGSTCSSFYGGSPAKSRSLTDITVATTHQALRFYRCFDLTVLDEVDAFPYQGSRMLEHAVRSARRQGGKTLFMSATPSRGLMEAARRGDVPVARIPARHHGHPLPVPEVLELGAASDALLGGAEPAVPEELASAVCESLDEGHAHFVFVPRKAAAEAVAKALARSLESRGRAGAKVGWSHSSDPGREAKRKSFATGDMDVLVCTSIMERGVTVPGCDVTVLGSDKEAVFDYRALVQMAGRAGRQQARPTGRVLFLCGRANGEMKEALGIIREMNEEAARNGFLRGERGV
ncbi:MAG: DEAD/DEAH box helicase family protein [Firmicutes bacterium]|nr:DEAD/DEAH box helicase family protein [Bacillota bacterium]